MTDTWTWATVTQASPLRIKVDGDTTALDATTDNLVGSLAVDDRVRVHLHSDGIIVTGIQGGGNRSNPNLLINSNFMVNQEGRVSGSSIADGAYFLDGWKNSTGAVTSIITWADSGGVRTLTLGIPGFPRIAEQVIEQQDVPAGAYTVSWPGGALGRLYKAGTTPPAFAASPITVTLDGAANVNLDLQGDGTSVNGWVKLERGTVATPYQSPKYGDNLRACMRYYQRLSAVNTGNRFETGMAYSTTGASINIHLLAPMRSTPTLTYSDLTLAQASTYGVTSAVLDGLLGNSVTVLFAVASGLTGGGATQLRAGGASAFIALDARL